MKTFFMQRKGLETMVYDLMKAEGLSREAAIKEIDSLIKASCPEADIIVLDEFSAARAVVETKR